MPSYSEVSQYLLDRLCTGLGLDSQLAEFQATQEFLLQSWAGAAIPAHPPYASLIGDDHSPFEYSVAFAAERPELRLLFEVQATSPNALANQQAALSFNEQLAAHYGASMTRFGLIQDLFVSDSHPGQFALWHGARFDARRPDLKVYLNPQTFGAPRALPLMSEALRRLGLGHAVSTIEQVVRSRGGRDQLNYFSLDLSAQESSRVKIYFRHETATAREVDELFSRFAPTHRAGDVIDFSQRMVGHDKAFVFKPVTSCFAFTEMSNDPSTATFHLPIAHYAANDALSISRSAAYLTSIGQPKAAEALERAVRAFAPRVLEIGAGVQSYASFRREASGLRFTAYLSPELYREAEATGSYWRWNLGSQRAVARETK